MKKLLAYFVVLILAAAPVAAQGPTLPGPGLPVSAATYVGPGNAKALSAWWGLLAYDTATAGTKSILLCDSAGANCADANTSASTGVLSAPGTRGADNCSVVSTCKIKTIYDKVGTRDLTQATAGNMPTLTPNALGSCYGITFTAANSTQLVAATSPSTSSPPLSIVIVAKYPSSAVNYGLLSMDDGSYTAGIVVDWDTSPNFTSYNGATINVNTSLNTWYAVQEVINGASSIVRLNASETTGLTAGTQALGPPSVTLRMGSENGAKFGNGLMMGAGYLASTAFSPSERNGIDTNLRATCGGW